MTNVCEEPQLSLDLGDPEVQAQLLEKLNALLESQVPLGDRLWTIKDCAVYFNTSLPTARRILARHGAPKPIRLPTSDDHRLPARYRADEIKKFSEKHRLGFVRR